MYLSTYCLNVCRSRLWRVYDFINALSWSSCAFFWASNMVMSSLSFSIWIMLFLMLKREFSNFSLISWVNSSYGGSSFFFHEWSSSILKSSVCKYFSCAFLVSWNSSRCVSSLSFMAWYCISTDLSILRTTVSIDLTFSVSIRISWLFSRTLLSV